MPETSSAHSHRLGKSQRNGAISGPNYIYIIAHPEGLRKIGISADPWRRARNLQGASPSRMAAEFFGLCPSGAAVRIEGLAHEILFGLRRHGEWFDVTADGARGAIARAALELGYEIVPVSVDQRPPRRGLGRPRSPDPMVSISVGFPASDLAALDGVVRQRRQIEPGVTRQAVVREAVAMLLIGQRRGKKRG